MISDKQFTDELFKRMYDLGFKKAGIDGDVLFFFNNEMEFLNRSLPRVMVASTCFEDKDQLIDIAEYLGIVDWSNIPVDTPVLVRDIEKDPWYHYHFSSYKNGHIFVWEKGKTSWTTDKTELFRFTKIEVNKKNKIKK